jgi:hypothetical protein
MTATAFARGMLVIADPEQGFRVQPEVLGRVFRVTKVNPKNVQAEATDGGRGINYPKDLLVPAPPEGEPVPAPVLGRPYQPREFFSAGEVVTMSRPYKEFGTESPMVVLKDNDRKVNVAPLGGDRDRYIRCPPDGLVKRDLAWLAERLIEEV